MKERILMVVFVLVLGTILTVSLIAVDFVTDPVIARNEAVRVKSSVLAALAVPCEAADVESTFDSAVETRTADKVTYYVSRDGAMAVPFDGTGLWGPITGIIALNPDLETLKAVTIIAQEETPGLGGEIGAEWFQSQFEGKKIFDEQGQPGLRIVKAGEAAGQNVVDSITGATMTSQRVEIMLNDVIKAWTGEM